MKKAKKLKIMLLSLFIKRVFYSCEDIVGIIIVGIIPAASKPLIIILVFEMIVCLNNPPSMKRFQITQFGGYFNIARCNAV